MRQRRGLTDARLLCSGPGRVGQALGIDATFNGLSLDAPPFLLLPTPVDSPMPKLVEGPRIGISKAIDLPWRFGEKNSRFLSRPFTAK